MKTKQQRFTVELLIPGDTNRVSAKDIADCLYDAFDSVVGLRYILEVREEDTTKAERKK